MRWCEFTSFSVAFIRFHSLTFVEMNAAIVAAAAARGKSMANFNKKKLCRTKASLERDIIECVQNAGGIVFGGCLRDKIIHDTAATSFYEAYNKDTEREPKESVYGDMNIAYIDETYNPASAEARMLVANDIDVFFKHNEGNGEDNNNICVAKFMKLLTKNHMWFSGVHTRNAYGLDGNANVRVDTIKVAYWIPPCMRYGEVFEAIVKVDIVTGPAGLEPPFGKIDLECNGVLLTADNEYRLIKSLYENDEHRVSMSNIRGEMSAIQKLKKLNEVIADINLKKTRLVNPDVNSYRIDKLVEVGWAVQGTMFIATKVPAPSCDELCFICLNSFTKGHANILMACCKGAMHTKCARDWVTKANTLDVCPRCGTSKDFDVCDADKKLVAPADRRAQRGI